MENSLFLMYAQREGRLLSFENPLLLLLALTPLMILIMEEDLGFFFFFLWLLFLNWNKYVEMLKIG